MNISTTPVHQFPNSSSPHKSPEKVAQITIPKKPEEEKPTLQESVKHTKTISHFIAPQQDTRPHLANSIAKTSIQYTGIQSPRQSQVVSTTVRQSVSPVRQSKVTYIVRDSSTFNHSQIDNNVQVVNNNNSQSNIRLSKSTYSNQPQTTTTTYVKYLPPQQIQQKQQQPITTTTSTIIKPQQTTSVIIKQENISPERRIIAQDPSPISNRILSYSQYSTNTNNLNSHTNLEKQTSQTQIQQQESVKRSQVIYKASPVKQSISPPRQTQSQVHYHRQNIHQQQQQPYTTIQSQIQYKPPVTTTTTTTVQQQQQNDFREGVKRALNVQTSSQQFQYHNPNSLTPQDQYNFQRNYSSLNYFKYNKNSRPTTPTQSRGTSQYSQFNYTNTNQVQMDKSNPYNNNMDKSNPRSSFISQTSAISQNNMTEIKATKKVDRLKKSQIIPDELLEKKVPFQIDLKERIEVYMRVYNEYDDQFFDAFQNPEYVANFQNIRQLLEVYETTFFLHYLKFFYLPQSHLSQDKSQMIAYHSQDPFYLSVDGHDQSITEIKVRLLGPEKIPIVVIKYLEKTNDISGIQPLIQDLQGKQMVIMLHYQEQLVDWLYMISCMASVPIDEESIENLKKFDNYARRSYNYDLNAQPFKTQVNVLAQSIQHIKSQNSLQVSQHIQN